MIKKIIAGLMLTGVCYGWITQSDIAVNNLLQYSPSVRTGDMLIMTRPGVAGTATGWTYTTNGAAVTDALATKVSNNSGVATNLTVYDALDVRSVTQSIPAVISGNDAGDFAGTYTYAGSSEWLGNYYTNANGKFLYYVNYESFGSW